MRFRQARNDGDLHAILLTRGNLMQLLEKLDAPVGQSRTLINSDQRVMITAVEDSDHYDTDSDPDALDLHTGEVRHL